MKNKWSISGLSIFFFLLTIAITLLSWVGSVYAWGNVQSLLSAEGIRWILSRVVENYVHTPALGIVLIAFMGIGVGSHSGLYEALLRYCRKGRFLSRKERRSLALSVGVFGFYWASIGVVALLPWNFLQNVMGGWLSSPFSEGFVYIASLSLGLLGMVYGYASGAFRRVSDVVNGMSSLIAVKASYFVYLFFVVQFFSSLDYTLLAQWMCMDGWLLQVLFQVLCYAPLLIFRR